MKTDILQYFSRTRAGFLHAVGEAGTERLLECADFKKDEVILELGFGTGATLVKIVSKNKSANVHGIERSEFMFHAAKARLKFCGLEKCVDLKNTDTLQTLPYPDHSFDKVIAESVLAVQEGNDLPFLISELHRILKPGGKLFANETLWLPSVSGEEIDIINRKCKNSFGIIQSNAAYKDQSGWKNLLKSCDFQVQRMEVIDHLEGKRKMIPENFTEMKSRVFTLLGKCKGNMDHELKSEFRLYEEQTDAIYDRSRKYMEGVIMIAQKNLH